MRAGSDSVLHNASKSRLEKAIIAVYSKCHRQKVFYFLMNGLNNLPHVRMNDKELES